MSIAVYYKQPVGLSGVCGDMQDGFILLTRGVPWLKY